MSENLINDLNRALEEDFPAAKSNRPLRLDAQMLQNRPQQPASAIPEVGRAQMALQIARPLVRLADALDRIDQLAAQIEKAEAEAAKLLSVVKGKL